MAYRKIQNAKYEAEYFAYNRYRIDFFEPYGKAKYDRNQLIESDNKNKENTYLLFWGHQKDRYNKITKACLSQWWETPFVVDGINYSCMEQYMMVEKARLFNNLAIEKRIMAATSPKEIKALGRKVTDFDEEIWNAVKYTIVVKGNYHKFSQNPDLKQFLIATENKILVEASPYDAVWGIKMGIEDSNITNPSKWQGENLLGFALMEVRDRLK